MNLESVMSDVKAKVGVVQTRAQDVADVSVDTFKQAGDIVVTGVQGLMKTSTDAATELFSFGKASFEKAKADGLAAVVSNPMVYMPEGRERIIVAFNDGKTTVFKTSEELSKVLKTGYESVSAKIIGASASEPPKPAAKKVAAKKTAAKKVAAKKAAE